MSPAPAARAFRADIQGMRAFAVLAVVAGHAGLPFAHGGYVGVDVFFVISGYLITAQLLKERSESGRTRFASFYARRARRILPASFAVLALTVVAGLAFVPPALRAGLMKDAIATALYVPNLAFAAQQTDYLANPLPSVFQHYWSLGVEEQFYLVWPALLAGAAALAAWWFRRRRRNAPLAAAAVASRGATVIGVVMAGVLVASLAACIVQTTTDEPWAFFSPWTRAWEFALGGLIALVERRPASEDPSSAGSAPVRSRVPSAAWAVLAWTGFAGILACIVLYSSATVFPGIAVIAPVVAAGAMILGGGRAGALGPVRVLALAPAQFLGAISYSLYLVHWPLLQLVQASVGYEQPLPLWATTGLALLAVPLAWLMYRLVENPARGSASIVRRTSRTLLGAGVVSVVLAASCAVALVVVSAQPMQSSRVAASAPASSPPVETPFVPSNLTPDLAHAADDDPVLYSDSCELGSKASTPHPCSFGSGAKSMVLFGDSHAAMWFPALQSVAQDAGYTLQTQTKSGCPSVAVNVVYKTVPYTSCTVWRQNVIDDLIADPPDLVVLADYTNPTFADARDESGQWTRGLKRVIGELSPHTQVVVMADTPDMRVSPIDCLSAHLDAADACAEPATKALSTPGRGAQTAVTDAMHVPLIDLDGYLCASTCPAIIGDTLVYRDSHHLTATFAAKLTGPLEGALDPFLSSTP